MEYPDNTPTPPDPYQTLGADDPPEDSDDPPEVVTDEGGTVRPKDVRIRILSPEENQGFTAEGGLVSLDLHGKITYIKSNGQRVSLPDRFYKWLIDQDPMVIMTGAQGTVQVPLAPGKHNVVLRIGASSHSHAVTIEAVPGVAPTPDPDPEEPADEPPAAQESPSLIQQIINFFRRLFGG